MIRRMFSASLALLVALSGAPELRAQVLTGRSAAVPSVTGTLGAVSAPTLAPLSAPSALSLTPGIAPSLAIPTLAPAPALAASIVPAAAKPVAPFPGALAASPMPSAAVEKTLAPHEVQVLRKAWQAAHALVEDIPGAPDTLADAPIAVRNPSGDPSRTRETF
jgi:hypothetical protein